MIKLLVIILLTFSINAFQISNLWKIKSKGSISLKATLSSPSEQTSLTFTKKEPDVEILKLIKLEDERQRKGLELIASENFVSANVREALGSRLTNKYSEGMVGKRYYGGNKYIDEIESLCMSRALELYKLSSEEWGVNVQPYSGSPANFATYTALLSPHDRIMGLDLPSGGHLTHGYISPRGKKVSSTSVYFESMPYVVNPNTGLIDYDDLAYRAKIFQPKLLIAGASAYPREWDYKRMRQIADEVNAILMTDMAHISGLVAAECVASPFQYSDVVTTTTHKTLRGPRSGMIFAKKPFMERINSAVFPMLQGGPHNHQIAAVAVALNEAQSDEFRYYARNVIENAKALASAMRRNGHLLATGGTDNHLILWDVRQPWNLTGFMVERVLEEISITTNRNSIYGDVSAINPGGVRLGTPALTTRGFQPEHFSIVANFLHEGCMLAVQIKSIAQEIKSLENYAKSEKIKIAEFTSVLKNNSQVRKKVEELKNQVEAFATRFELP